MIDLKRLKGSREYLLLFGIAVVALGLRLFTFKFNDLLIYDPYHHYAIAKYIVENNEFPFIWYLSMYPFGRFIFEPMGLYYVSVIFYKILSSFDISFFQAFKMVTPVFGTLTIIATYFLTKHVFNKKIAVLTAIIMAFLPGFSYRTFSGFYRGDVFPLPFMIAGFYLFLLSLDREIKGIIPLSVLAGICFGIMSLVWGGYLYGFVVLTAFSVIYSATVFIQGKDLKPLLLSYLIAAGIGILILQYSIIIQPHRRYTEDMVRYIFPSTILFTTLLAILKIKAENLDATKRAYAVISVILVSIIAIYRLDPELISRLLTGYGGVIARTEFAERIVELQPISTVVLWQKYAFLSFLFPLGFIYLAKDFYEEVSKEKLFVSVWFIVSMYLLLNAIRYAFLAAIPISIVSALFIYRLEGKLEVEISERGPITKKMPQMVSLIIILTVVFYGVDFANGMSPAINKEWREALSELKKEEKGNVLVWWGRGSWVQGITGFPTVVDTVHGQNRRVSKEVAEFFFEKNESRTFELLRKYHIDYVIAPIDLIPQVPNMVYFLGTPGYQYTIYPYTTNTYLRGLPTRVYSYKFYVQDLNGYKVVYYQAPNGELLEVRNVYYQQNGRLFVKELKNLTQPYADGGVYIARDSILYISPKLVGSLMDSLVILNGYGFENYKLIFSNSQVKIYKPVYNYTRIDEIKTDRLHYKKGEEVKISARMKSTTPFKGELRIRIKDPDKAIVFNENYTVTGDSSLEIDFIPSSEAVEGDYLIRAALYDEKDARIEVLKRVFKVT